MAETDVRYDIEYITHVPEVLVPVCAAPASLVDKIVRRTDAPTSADSQPSASLVHQRYLAIVERFGKEYSHEMPFAHLELPRVHPLYGDYIQLVHTQFDQYGGKSLPEIGIWTPHKAGVRSIHLMTQYQTARKSVQPGEDAELVPWAPVDSPKTVNLWLHDDVANGRDFYLDPDIIRVRSSIPNNLGGWDTKDDLEIPDMEKLMRLADFLEPTYYHPPFPGVNLALFRATRLPFIMEFFGETGRR